MTDDLLTMLEFSAIRASLDDYTLEEYLEACAEAYCEVHNMALVDCIIEIEVGDKPEAN